MSISYKTINTISWITLIIFITTNLVFIANSSVNIPYWDEWVTITKILSDFSLENIIAFHNEHRIVFTKLLLYASYYLNDLNIVYLIIINYFLYIIAIFILYIIVKKIATDIPYLPLFFIPLFSPLLAESFMWSFLNQFTFTIIFGLLAVYFGFIKKRNNLNTIIMTLFLLLSTLSISFVFPFGIMVAYIIKELSNNFIFKLGYSKVDIYRLIITTITFFFIVYLPFFYFNAGLDTQAILSSPLTLNFWLFVIKSYMFIATTIPIEAVKNGLATMSIEAIFLISISIIATILATITILISLLNKKELLKPEFQACVAIAFGVFSAMFITAIGRASIQVLVPSRNYFLYVILIPIISVLVINLYKRNKKNSTLILLVTYFLILSINTVEHMKFDKYYDIEKTRLDGIECIELYYSGNGDSLCESIYSEPLVNYLKQSHELKLSFTK